MTTRRLTDDELDAALRLEPDALSKIIRSMTLPPDYDPYDPKHTMQYPGGGLQSIRGPRPETGNV